MNERARMRQCFVKPPHEARPQIWCDRRLYKASGVHLVCRSGVHRVTRHFVSHARHSATHTATRTVAHTATHTATHTVAHTATHTATHCNTLTQAIAKNTKVYVSFAEYRLFHVTSCHTHVIPRDSRDRVI